MRPKAQSFRVWRCEHRRGGSPNAGRVRSTKPHCSKQEFTEQCFTVYENDDGDRIYISDEQAADGELVAGQVAGMLETARSGFDQLAGTPVPKVDILISPRASVGGDDLGHAVNSKRPCRVAIFAPDGFFTADNVDFTLAHELFHCVQGVWDGEFGSDQLSEEGGADYFAWKLTGSCADQIDWGSTLDQKTAKGSLLDLSYAGWWFWAYLDENRGVSSQSIASLHQGVKLGTPIPDGLEGLVGDVPAVVNEFFVRLVGPGLACELKGNTFTEEEPIMIAEEKVVDLAAQLWQGTRYKLTYEELQRYVQVDQGGGPIGMAKENQRRDEGDWVVYTQEVRTGCEDDEKWVAVVTSPSNGGGTHSLEVEIAEKGSCDPCMLGFWSVDITTLEKFYEAFSPGENIELGGAWTIGFGPDDDAGDALFTDERDITLMLPDRSSTFSLALSGFGSAEYTANEVTFAVDAYIDGGTASIQGYSSPFANASGDGALLYICDGDRLDAQIGNASFVANRVPPTPEDFSYFG